MVNTKWIVPVLSTPFSGFFSEPDQKEEKSCLPLVERSFSFRPERFESSHQTGTFSFQNHLLFIPLYTDQNKKRRPLFFVQDGKRGLLSFLSGFVCFFHRKGRNYSASVVAAESSVTGACEDFTAASRLREAPFRACDQLHTGPVFRFSTRLL